MPVFSAQGAVDLRLGKVTTVSNDLTHEVVPRCDDQTVQIKVEVQVVDGAAGPFDIVTTLGDQIRRKHFDGVAEGVLTITYKFPLFGIDPQTSIKLDPQGTSGDRDRSNNSFVAQLQFAPGGPANPIAVWKNWKGESAFLVLRSLLN